MLYDSICWTACLDFYSYLRMVCKELMFLFCRIEKRYHDMNAHSSLNKFIE